MLSPGWLFQQGHYPSLTWLLRQSRARQIMTAPKPAQKNMGMTAPRFRDLLLAQAHRDQHISELIRSHLRHILKVSTPSQDFLQYLLKTGFSVQKPYVAALTCTLLLSTAEAPDLMQILGYRIWLSEKSKNLWNIYIEKNHYYSGDIKVVVGPRSDANFGSYCQL